MVFDAPPCNNHEVPMYFLKKMYCKFVLGEISNYFDILESRGRGGGHHLRGQGHAMTLMYLGNLLSSHRVSM